QSTARPRTTPLTRMPRLIRHKKAGSRVLIWRQRRQVMGADGSRGRTGRATPLGAALLFFVEYKLVDPTTQFVADVAYALVSNSLFSIKDVKRWPGPNLPVSGDGSV